MQTNKLKRKILSLFTVAVMFVSMLAGTMLPNVVQTASAYTYANKQWGTDITDAKLNKWNGQRMTCDQYFKAAVPALYGISVPGGSAKAIGTWLEQNFESVGKDAKPGDFVYFFGGKGGAHVAIMGSNNTLHHGGIGGIGATQVVWKYTPTQMWTGSGAGFKDWKAFRPLQPKGFVKVTKSAAANEGFLKDCPNSYSLGGAEFTLYNGGSAVATITTRDDGSSDQVSLQAGTYTVKETKAPKGFAINPEVKTITVQPGQVEDFAFADLPQNDPINVLLRKLDAETGKASALGGATLEGAEFEMKLYDGQFKTEQEAEAAGKPVRTWVFKTNEDGIVSLGTKEQAEKALVSGEFYTDSNGDFVFPLGTYVVKEKTAPKGYLLNDEVFVRNVTAEGTVEHVSTYNEPAVSEQVKRGDLEFVKIEDGTNHRMSNIPFKLTNVKTGESHVIVTDDNGQYKSTTSWNKHSFKTNENDKALSGEKIDESKLDSEYGVWFENDQAGNKALKVNDKLGALPYGEYTLDEIECEANDGKVLLKDIKVMIKKDANVVNMGTLTNDQGEPELKTTASDKTTKDHVGVAGKTKVVDKVEYKNLIKGKEYVVKGVLMDKATEKPVLIDGKKVTAEKKFKAEKSKGFVELEYELDASSLEGKSVVVFEDLFKDGKKVGSHANIEDEGQTVEIPKVRTTAKSADSGSNVGSPNKQEKIIDTVKYHNLIVGKEYTVKGKLMDKDSGKAIKDKDGKEITAEKKFVADKKDGSVDLEFVYDSSALQGKTTVVFEDLFYNGVKIATHSDLNDKDQSIKYPKIGTTLTDNKGNKTVIASKETKLVDTVKYENLVPGREYTMKGTLMVKDKNDPLVENGKPVEATGKFTPNTPNGSTKITFTVDTTKLEGKELVAFEVAYNPNGDEIASHKDINDGGQTVKVVAPGHGPKTGDKGNIALFGLILVVAVGGLCYAVKRKKK